MNLSIIVPVYNVQEYVRPCLSSIFAQGLNDDDFEVIIVNDGTTDKSIEVIADIIEAHKNTIVFNQENQGLSMARNNGMANANGEYLLFLDSDDLLIEGSLNPLLQTALESKADMVVADFVKMNDQEIAAGPLPKYPDTSHLEETNGYQLYQNDFTHNTCYVWHTLHRTEFIRQNNITFIPGIYFEDIPFTTECLLRARKCIRAHYPLNIYRQRDASISDVASFNMRKAQDFTTSLVRTWELRKMDGLSPDIESTMKKKLYASYASLLYCILYKTNETSEQIRMVEYLWRNASELICSFSFKQKLGFVIFNLSPRLYITAQKWAWKH